MKTVSWSFVLAGFGSLLVSAYYDNIRGPLIPEVARVLGLSFAQSGWFLAICSASGTLAALGLMRALNRWSERTVIVALSALALTAALSAVGVSGFASLAVLAVLIGATISTLGSMANVLLVEGVPPERSGRFLSALHAMFGIGSMIATTAVGVASARGFSWSTLYLAGIPAVLILGMFAAARLGRGRPKGALTIQSEMPTKAHGLVIATFAVYVAGEVTAAAWMTSYLVGARGLTTANAAPYLTAFYFTMTVTRVLCAFVVTPAREAWLLRAALVLPIASFGAAFLGHLWALALVGLLGPFFPVFLGRASRAFPDTWRSLTLWTIVGMNIMLGIFNVTLGDLADRVGIAQAYLLPAGLLAAAFMLLQLCLKRWQIRER